MVCDTAIAFLYKYVLKERYPFSHSLGISGNEIPYPTVFIVLKKKYIYIYTGSAKKCIHVLRDVIYVLLFEVEVRSKNGINQMNASVTMWQAGQSSV